MPAASMRKRSARITGELLVDGQAPTLADGLRDRDAPRMLLTRPEVESLWKGQSRVCVLAPAEHLDRLALAPTVELTRSLDRVLVCNRSAANR